MSNTRVSRIRNKLLNNRPNRHVNDLGFFLILFGILYVNYGVIRNDITETKTWSWWERSMTTRMTSRRHHLQKECSRTGLDGPGYNASTWEFFINREYHIIWCNVFKAASTSWLYNFNIMANYSPSFLNSTRKVPVQIARYKYPRPTLKMVEDAQMDSLTFLIVRHPLKRLVSAYVDKIVNAVRKTEHYSLRLLIVKRYRKKKPTDDIIPLPKARRSRGRKAKQHTKAMTKKKKKKQIADVKCPLFEEFVSFVLDEAKANHTLDMHWTPYTAFCTPCKISFDIILKLETLNDDQEYLIQLAHLGEVIHGVWMNNGSTNDDHVERLYSRISRQQLDGLYELYKYDFQLFNYSIEKYYYLVGANNE